MPRKTFLCPKGVYESTDWSNIKPNRWMCGVLMDNWYEDSQLRCPKPERKPMADETEYRVEYGPYEDGLETNNARLRNRIRHNFKSTQLLFNHHEKPSPKHMITIYDEHINRRLRPCNQQFPEHRTYKISAKAWIPEKIDYPLTGRPTNWGLADWKDARYHSSLRDLLGAYKDVQSVYATTFINHYQRQQNLKKKIPCYLKDWKQEKLE